MVWKALDRIATLAYLLLSTILITILMTNSSENAGVNNYAQKLEVFRQENLKVMSNNMNYFDTRVNKLAETQDSYQVSTTQRMDIVESQMKALMLDKKNNQRIINNNQSNAVIYQNSSEPVQK